MLSRSVIFSLLFLVLLPTTSIAKETGRCEDLAHPREFNKDTAMEAIFCEYNREHGGTLLPLKYTQSWNTKEAEYLATPILAATYRENGIERGVIVIQRQGMEPGTGEIDDSHVTTATVSVYVFKHYNTQWIYEKGRKEVLNDGTHGLAPGVKLIKLGPDKYGLWFEGGDIGQGYTNDYAEIVTLSEQNIGQVGDFDTGASNSGICSDDPKERAEYSTVGACWGYEGRPEFISHKESGYYMLRIAYKGTEETDKNKIIPKTDPICYVFSGEKYDVAKDGYCSSYDALAERGVFSIGANEDRKQPYSEHSPKVAQVR